MTRLHAAHNQSNRRFTAFQVGREVDQAGVGCGLPLLHLDGARGPR